MGIVERNIPTANCSKIPKQVQRNQNHIFKKFNAPLEIFILQGQPFTELFLSELFRGLRDI